jgi:hypothetical protein
MKKGMRERGVNGDDACNCCFGELLDNNKPFRPLYIFKHVLKNKYSFHYILLVQNKEMIRRDSYTKSRQIVLRV